jgi:DNA polymerase-3 subunit beta
MNIELSTRDFKNMLKVTDRIKSLEDVEDLKGIVVNTLDNKTQFIKSNLETTIIYTTEPTDVKSLGTVTLPIQTAEIIKKIKENYLIITDDSIKTERKEIKYNRLGSTLEKINTYDNMEKIFSTTQNELLRMLEVSYATAQDETRPILTGIYFFQNETCALDGYRMSVRKSEQYNSKSKFVVNKNSIEILKAILNNTDDIVNVFYNNDNTVVKFELDNNNTNIKIIAKCLEGEFIRYEQIIPDEYNNTSIIKPQELQEELEFIMEADQRGFIKTVFTEDKVILKGNQCKEVYSEDKSNKLMREKQYKLDQDYNEKMKEWKEKKTKAQKNNKPFNTKQPEKKEAKFKKMYELFPVSDIISEIKAENILEDKEFVIAYNPRYMVDAMKQYKDKVEIRMSSRVSPIVITIDNENLELVLPVRLPV